MRFRQPGTYMQKLSGHNFYLLKLKLGNVDLNNPISIQLNKAHLQLFSVPNCLTKWLYHVAFPPATTESSYCSTSSLPFGVVSILEFSYSNRYIMVPHCCFNLQFPSDIKQGASFHMSSHHFCCIVFIGRNSTGPVHTQGEGIIQGHEEQEMGPLGTISEAAQHNLIQKRMEERNLRQIKTVLLRSLFQEKKK